MMFVFLTGMSRSGTTILNQCFNKFPLTQSFSQPLPLLYREAKSVFFKGIGHPETFYVLNNYFDESRYSLTDLVEFLDRWKVSPDLVRNLLAKMMGWSGQQTELRQEELLFPKEWLGLTDTIEGLLSQMARQSTNFLVTKEIHCEDFISTFLKRGWKVILIIRNPLDVITSIQYGRGIEYAGERRPTLFHVRNWRKSAHFAIHHLSNPSFRVVRYEDLVKDSRRELSQLAEFLCIRYEEVLARCAFDRHESPRPGNSSFPSKSKDTNFFSQIPIGRHKRLMSLEIREFVSSLCWPEMKFFGYTDSPLPKHYDPTIFSETFSDIKTEFSPAFSSIDQADKERERLLAISRGSFLAEEHERLFLNKAVFNALLRKSPYQVIK